MSQPSVDGPPTSGTDASVRGADRDFELGPMREDEVPAIAGFHHGFFGSGEMHGFSLANLGRDFLEAVFYRLNLDNPYLFVDVARYRGEPIAFSVYASDYRRVFRFTIRKHFASLAGIMLRLSLRHPVAVVRHVWGNRSFLTNKAPEAVRRVPGYYFLLGVREEYRSREFKLQTGIKVADRLWRNLEDTLRGEGCKQLWSSVGAHNEPMNALHVRRGMRVVATAPVQGVPSNYYLKSLVQETETR